MTYYYRKNNKGEINRPYYRNKTYKNKSNQLKSNRLSYILDSEKDLESLIIDENTVYEIDEECLKRLLASNKQKRNDLKKDS